MRLRRRASCIEAAPGTAIEEDEERLSHRGRRQVVFLAGRNSCVEQVGALDKFTSASRSGESRAEFY